MYIIGLLGGLRLYQTRHQDVVINSHLAYASFAVVIFTSVIGVVSILLFLLCTLLFGMRIRILSNPVCSEIADSNVVIFF